VPEPSTRRDHRLGDAAGVVPQRALRPRPLRRVGEASAHVVERCGAELSDHVDVRGGGHAEQRIDLGVEAGGTLPGLLGGGAREEVDSPSRVAVVRIAGQHGEGPDRPADVVTGVRPIEPGAVRIHQVVGSTSAVERSSDEASTRGQRSGPRRVGCGKGGHDDGRPRGVVEAVAVGGVRFAAHRVLPDPRSSTSRRRWANVGRASRMSDDVREHGGRPPPDLGPRHVRADLTSRADTVRAGLDR
jgi:hypothetical protein